MLPTEPVFPGSLQNFAWLVGTRTGKRGEDTIEETWLPEADNALFSSFRWTKSTGEVVVYEVQWITLLPDGSVKLSIKHFDRNRVSKEDKEDSFELTLTDQSQTRSTFFNNDSDNPIWLILEDGEDKSAWRFVRRGSEPDSTQDFSYPKLNN